ncbi:MULTISPECIES: DUF308 domain-containing protein [Corallincola]|uniref:HdeD family acid-resistance protein n=3 Tax=Corallincola TaxID=1775176 RepID=A0A368NL16_9GAMM|nr:MULTISPECIES: DUF308 domain-containing protein [Corallincola]RCU50856.1 hypothetical protein DU002_05890 [Corallincola holothuriorum]TAA45815.1 hypothetical protein EXY25_10680 [Corallincola spongiicola]TCI03912.1 hypothetical protein EZV61_06875 [Corallincola luteus]
MAGLAPMTEQARTIARLMAVAMMVLGGLAIILPFAVGIAAAIIVGIAITLTGVMGIAVSKRMKQAGYQTISGFLYWGYLIVGVLLILMPKLTLGLAAFMLGAFFVFIGVLSWRAAQNDLSAATTKKVKGALSMLLGVAIVLSGASGIAWLIGVCFGVSLFMQGMNVWSTVSRSPVMFEADS